MEVARGTFYNHIFRRADHQKYQDEKMQLMLRMKQIFDDSEQRYGAGKIRAVLAGTGQEVSTKRASSMMQEFSLQRVRTDAKKILYAILSCSSAKTKSVATAFYCGLSQSGMGGDITYFKVNNSKVYLCTIIDLFPRRVVGYRISHSASTRLVTTTFQKAYAERGNPAELTFHSDRGGQYISDTFSKLLQNCHVKQSFSASGCPYDNAAAESFFATFKKEEAYRREYTSERHFQKCVEEYIQFYNEVRPHQTLDYKTPQAFEAAHEGNYIEK